MGLGLLTRWMLESSEPVAQTVQQDILNPKLQKPSGIDASSTVQVHNCNVERSIEKMTEERVFQSK